MNEDVPAEDANPATKPLLPLDPRQKTVLRIRAAIFGLIPAGILIVADLIVSSETAWPRGFGIALAILLYALLVFVLPGRRYRRWGYHEGERGIRIASGLIVRRDTIVPYDRVQHIDVSRGPIERSFGVSTLTLHTAGSYNSTVDLPGLAIDEANRMRDEIRSYISEDLA